MQKKLKRDRPKCESKLNKYCPCLRFSVVNWQQNKASQVSILYNGCVFGLTHKSCFFLLLEQKIYFKKVFTIACLQCGNGNSGLLVNIMNVVQIIKLMEQKIRYIYHTSRKFAQIVPKFPFFTTKQIKNRRMGMRLEYKNVPCHFHY